MVAAIAEFAQSYIAQARSSGRCRPILSSQLRAAGDAKAAPGTRASNGTRPRRRTGTRALWQRYPQEMRSGAPTRRPCLGRRRTGSLGTLERCGKPNAGCARMRTHHAQCGIDPGVGGSVRGLLGGREVRIRHVLVLGSLFFLGCEMSTSPETTRFVLSDPYAAGGQWLKGNFHMHTSHSD